MLKTFRPDIRSASELPAQTELQDKFGGKPWGLPKDKWPKCAECGEAMSFLCQFSHNADRIDLGRDGRVLYLFMCNHNAGLCETWDQDSGANAVVVVEREQLTNGLTAPPSAADEEGEYLVVGYVEAGGDEVWETHLGGEPMFVQDENEAPGAPYRYVMHFADMHYFLQDGHLPAQGPNFGDAGCGYAYVNTQVNPPVGKFFWQCS